MATVELTVQDVVRTGLEATYSSADGTSGNVFENDGKTFVHIINGSGGSITATFDVVFTELGLTVPDLDVAVPAGEDRFIGPFPAAVYNQEDTENSIDEAVLVTFSAVTSVTIAALRLTPVP